MNVLTTKFAMVPATLMLALGIMTTSVTQAEAGRRNGHIIAGVIAGAAVAAILSNRRHRRHRKHRRYNRRHHYSAYDRPYHIHYNRYDRPYRCYRNHGRRYYSRRNRYNW